MRDILRNSAGQALFTCSGLVDFALMNEAEIKAILIGSRETLKWNPTQLIIELFMGLKLSLVQYGDFQIQWKKSKMLSWGWQR